MLGLIISSSSNTFRKLHIDLENLYVTKKKYVILQAVYFGNRKIKKNIKSITVNLFI